MQIREIYDINYKIGALGASTVREYIDVRTKSKSIPIKTKKRQTFVADIQKLSKKIPGPGKYETNPQDQNYAKKVYRRVDYNARPKKSFLEQLIKQKKNIPGVGKYELVLQKNDKIRQWHSILGDKQKKKTLIFRNDIFDDCKVDCINVDPGSYNTQVPFVKVNKFQTTAPLRKNDDKQKEQKDKKHTKSLPKLPSAQTYHPIPNDYQTFEKLLSRRDKDPHHSNFSKNKRFIYQKQISPGPKYSLIAVWSPKNNSTSKQKGINIFKSMSNLPTPSIYY